MLKKKLSIEAIEWGWGSDFFKVPSILIIPPGCWRIGNWAFSCCMNLKKVIISESVEDIGIGAFECCKNATIILKKSKKDFATIGDWAFNGCKDVKEEIRY